MIEKYLWSGMTQLLAVYNPDDTLKMRFEYADDRMPVSMTANGQRYYFACDQVGSLRIVANSSGTVVKRIEYDTFGNILNDSDPLFDIPFGFAGGLYDRDTGLIGSGVIIPLVPDTVSPYWEQEEYRIKVSAPDENVYGVESSDLGTLMKGHVSSYLRKFTFR